MVDVHAVSLRRADRGRGPRDGRRQTDAAELGARGPAGNLDRLRGTEHRGHRRRRARQQDLLAHARIEVEGGRRPGRHVAHVVPRVHLEQLGPRAGERIGVAHRAHA